MRKQLLLSIIVMSQLTGMAQQAVNSGVILLDEQDLHYHSNYEYKVFDEFEDGNEDFLALFASLNPETEEREVKLYRDWINEIVITIRDGKFERLNEEKKIKAVSAYVKKTLLINYVQKTTFDELFSFGNYNFITAACIYALIFDELEIPYIIKESSSHIYLLAYPQSEKILIETIIPEFRYFMFDHNTRSTFVDYLLDNQIIDDLEYKSQSTSDLFEKYFFPQLDFTLKELAGLQYMHSGMEDVKNNDHKSAYFKFQKAYYLYPSYKIQYMLLTELYTFLESMDYTKSENLAFLAIGARYIPIGFEPGYFLQRFVDLTDIYLEQQQDFNEYERIYRYLYEKVENEYLKTEMSFYYYYETGRAYSNSGKYEQALDQAEKAFQFKPESPDLHNLFVNTLAGFANTNGSVQLIPRLEQYDEEFPQITSSDIYIQVKLHTYILYAGESFQVQDAVTGNEYLQKFEELFTANPEVGVDQYLIGGSYSSAAIYYYKKGEKARSKEMVIRGLELAPDNTELRLKLDSFKD